MSDTLLIEDRVNNFVLQFKFLVRLRLGYIRSFETTGNRGCYDV